MSYKKEDICFYILTTESVLFIVYEIINKYNSVYLFLLILFTNKIILNYSYIQRTINNIHITMMEHLLFSIWDIMIIDKFI